MWNGLLKTVEQLNEVSLHSVSYALMEHMRQNAVPNDESIMETKSLKTRRAYDLKRKEQGMVAGRSLSSTSVA